MENSQSDVIKQPGFLKSLIMTGQLTRLLIYLSATIVVVVCIVFAILSLIGVFQAFEIPMGDQSIILGTWYDFLVIGIVLASGIYGIYEYFRLKKVRKIDDRFPDFVRDLAESRRAGMTFTKAIMHSSKGNYGMLTSEIQNIARQISWGSGVEDALRAFSKRVNTKLINRTVNLIIEASRSGGNIADVLDAASKDAQEIKLIEAERRAGMLSYIAVVYVSMFVFLLIVVVLSKSLIPHMTAGNIASASSSNIPGGGSYQGGGKLSAFDVNCLFFSASIIQGGFMGIVAGVFENGNIISGIKHCFFMILINWVVLKFVVTGI